MKKIFLTLFIIAAGIGVNAQISKLEKLFDQYQDTKGVTSIKIAKPMFNLLNKLDIQDAGIDQIRPLIKDVNSIKILIFEKNKKDSIAPTVNMSKIRDEINSSIKNLKYEELMTVNSDGKKIKFLTQDTTTSVVKDLLLSITGDDENLFLLLDGKVNVDDISKLVNSDEKGDKGGKGPKGDKGKNNIMKAFSKIFALFVLLALLQSCIVSSSPNMEFLDRESLGKGAQVTAINPPMFLVKPFVKKALREDGESEEVIALIKKVKKVRVMTVIAPNANYQEKLNRFFTENKYEEWMTLNSEGQKVNIRAITNGDQINKLLIAVDGDKDGEKVFVDVRGNFTPEDISNIVNMASKSKSIN